MMSTKGFLSPDPDRRPRMTHRHKFAITKAVAAIFAHWVDKTSVGGMASPLAKSTMAMVAAAMEVYPEDRSCHTCDHFQGTTCAHWRQEVPPAAVEAGCDEHREHGAPF